MKLRDAGTRLKERLSPSPWMVAMATIASVVGTIIYLVALATIAFGREPLISESVVLAAIAGVTLYRIFKSSLPESIIEFRSNSLMQSLWWGGLTVSVLALVLAIPAFVLLAFWKGLVVNVGGYTGHILFAYSVALIVANLLPDDDDEEDDDGSQESTYDDIPPEELVNHLDQLADNVDDARARELDLKELQSEDTLRLLIRNNVDTDVLRETADAIRPQSDDQR